MLVEFFFFLVGLWIKLQVRSITLQINNRKKPKNIVLSTLQNLFISCSELKIKQINYYMYASSPPSQFFYYSDHCRKQSEHFFIADQFTHNYKIYILAFKLIECSYLLNKFK